jgi:hypothetical protein
VNEGLEHFNYGGGLGSSILHPFVLAAMILTIILIVALPRKYVIIPFLFSILMIPAGQQLIVGGVHLFVFRILILVGCARLITSHFTSSGAETLAGGFSALDKVFLVWALVRAIAPVLLYKEAAAVINSVGFLWDALGCYFFMRFLIRDQEDINRIIKLFSVVTIIVGLAMLREHFTGLDSFGFLGGIRTVLEVRNGTPRAQGPFQHALLAGTFGATLPPLFFWLWRGAKSRVLAVIGIIGCTLMATLTMCSSPVLVYASAAGALLLWPLRNRMRTLRWALVGACVLLQLVMKAPFYFAMAHIDLVGGSNSWYRAALIDEFVKNFGSWWLVGTSSNLSWAEGAMWDACNQFVAEGVAGGIVTLVLFIATISICFSWLGTARKSVSGDSQKEWFYWVLGATLFAHVVGFFGIDYFDQSRFTWYALIAMIGAVAAPALATARLPEKNPTPIPRHERGFTRPSLPKLAQHGIPIKYGGPANSVRFKAKFSPR